MHDLRKKGRQNTILGQPVGTHTCWFAERVIDQVKTKYVDVCFVALGYESSGGVTVDKNSCTIDKNALCHCHAIIVSLVCDK